MVVKIPVEALQEVEMSAMRMLQCDCKFHRGKKVYCALDTAIAEEDLTDLELTHLADSRSVVIESYPSHMYRDGEDMMNLRHRAGAWMAKVYYQDFRKNVDGHFDDAELVVEPEEATFVRSFVWNPLTHTLFEFLEGVYAYMNHLDVPKGHENRPMFEKIGHTSMSIGDFVVLRRCLPCTMPNHPDRESEQVWVVASQGWVTVQE